MADCEKRDMAGFGRLRPGRLLAWIGVGCILGSTCACDDYSLEVEWSETPDTVLLYSLARPELNLLSAMDLLSGYPVQIEMPGATGSWDFVLDTQDGALVFSPPGVFGISSTAGIAALEGVHLEDVTKAPSDSAAYAYEEPVPVDIGRVYVVQTHQSTNVYGYTCVYYGKMVPLEIDSVVDAVTFHYVFNPNCNNRRLVPS